MFMKKFNATRLSKKVQKKMEINHPTVFISYSWKNKKHVIKVLQLATRLMLDGVNVIIDKWDLRPGQDIFTFIENGFLNADKVLILCESDYTEKANNRIGGVGMEIYYFIEKLHGNLQPTKFLPVAMEEPISIPSFLKDRLFLRYVKGDEIEYMHILCAIYNSSATNTSYKRIKKHIRQYNENNSYKQIACELENTIQRYNASGEIIVLNPEISIPEQEVIIPSKEIVTSVNVIKESLVQIVRKDPGYIYTMTSRQFEEFIAEFYEEQGYKVELTKQTRDGGKDIILYTNGITGNHMYYVECKRFNQQHLVDVGIVRSFYGTIEADRATAGILITSSTFTKDAREYEKQIQRRMTLVDYFELLDVLSHKQ